MPKKQYLGMSANGQEDYVKKKILEFLELNENGVTVPDIVERGPFSPQTVIKHLERFVSSGKAYKIKRRNLTTYYLNGKPSHPEISINEEMNNGGVIRAKILNNKEGEFAYFEYMTENVNGGLLVKADDLKNFMEVASQLMRKLEIKQVESR